MNSTPNHKEQSHWRAGLASVDITPPEPIWQAGWGNRTQPSIGVTTRIFAKALALKHQDEPVSILLSSDLMAYSVEFVDEVVATTKKRFGIDRARLILCASHNHSAPVTTNVLPLYYEFTPQQYDVIQRYSDTLHDKFIEAIGRAIENLAPATLEFGNNMAGFAINRRRSRPDGRAWANVVDQDVPVLCVRDLEGKVRGIAFGYACHTTTVQDDTINGDYAGFAQEELEKLYPGAVALFINGCGGDQGPHPRFKTELGRTYGHLLATAVDDLIKRRMCPPATPVHGPLNAAAGVATLRFQKPPTLAEYEAMLPGRSAQYLREVQHQIDLLKAGKPQISEYPYSMQVWRFGSGQTFIIMSSEVVIDYQIKFKQKYGVDSTWVLAYANEHIAYIPSRRVLEEGGYEGTLGMLECGFPSPFTDDIESSITRTVEQLWDQAGPK
jgi:hypothetical protein